MARSFISQMIFPIGIFVIGFLGCEPAQTSKSQEHPANGSSKSNNHTSQPANSNGSPAEAKFVAEPGQDGILVFDKTGMDFGVIKKGEKLMAEYRYKNIGDHSLLIDQIIISCPCMRAEYPKDPIHPGQSGIIKGYFDSTNMPVAEYEKRFAVVVKGEQYAPSLAIKCKVVN